MNAARGHQAPRKEPNSWKVGRKKYKRQKKETKEGGRDFRPGKIVLKREKFPNTRKAFHCQIIAKLWKHKGQHKGDKNK